MFNLFEVYSIPAGSSNTIYLKYTVLLDQAGGSIRFKRTMKKCAAKNIEIWFRGFFVTKICKVISKAAGTNAFHE